ncbi:MAG: adenylate/guanylate cyclase domain-containing protein [Rhodospirillaceae bacterium]|nr:adenylate/guanylate cyclase domain-containing protein [Rhodospirillaceae bacterium]
MTAETIDRNGGTRLGRALGYAARQGRRFGSARIFGLAVLVLLIVLRAWDPAPVQIVRAKVFDYYQQLDPRVPEGYPVVIVDLDEASLAEIGQWPWPRTLIADMIVKLFQKGAITVGFDVVFAEPDRMNPDSIAGSLPQLDQTTKDALTKLPSNDAVLADILKQAPVVLGRAAHGGTDPEGTKLARPSMATVGGSPRPYIFNFPGIVTNTAVLEDAANGHGFFAIPPEQDGIARRVPAIVRSGKQVIPSLPIEVLRVATGQKSLAVKTIKGGGLGGVEAVVVANVEVPTDKQGRIWVRYGPHDKARYISAKDVLNGSVPAERIKGKLALVGTSAAGLLDVRATPFGILPGVEVHAQVIETILAQDYLYRPLRALFWEYGIIVIGGLLLVVFVPMIQARWTLALGFLVIAAFGGLSWHLFVNEGVLLDVSFPALAIFLIFAFMTYANYAREERQRREIRSAFGHYVSPALVERLAENPDQLVLGGESRNMTIMFCDVRGFTTISERLSAVELTALINRFLTPMTQIILERQGTIDKYIGDCIMALWNAPLDDEHQIENACRTTLAMLERLGPLNDELEAEAEAEGKDHIPIAIGIGLFSGECVVGNMGSDQRFDYSVLGDTVNLAARLEGQTKTYGVRIAIGEATQQGVPEFATLELDLIRVKGKFEPVRIFTLLGDEALAGEASFNPLKEAHDAMLAAFRAQDWALARTMAQRGKELCAPLEIEGLYDLYLQRIEEFEADPPGPDWDGVYVATSK